MALSDRISQVLDDIKITKKDPLQFAEEDLKLKLFPAQKFILKLFYNIPLSDSLEDNAIPIGDDFNETVLHVFTEVQFLEFLYKSNRVNIEDIDPDQVFIEVCFVIGRRGTKTTMSSIITLYTIYLLLLIDNPHEYFQILEEDEIGVAIVSNNRTGADKQLRAITKLIYKSPFFKKHLVKEPSNGELFLKSNRILHTKDQATRDLYKSKGDILISTYAANPNVRGSSNIVTISDEIAHYMDADVSSKKNPLDKMVFEALTPSTSGFVEPDGRPAGKNFYISSPNGERGLLYDIYKSAMGKKGQKTNTLVINVPSHWVNHRIAPSLLRTFYNKSARSYEQEYLAKFIKSTGSWLLSIASLVNAAFDANHDNNLLHRYNPLYTYFLGIDFGLGNDGTAFAVAHYQPSRPTTFEWKDDKWIVEDAVTGGFFVVDHIGYLLPEEGESLQIDDIMAYINTLQQNFKIEKGIYDQWSGEIFNQLLQKQSFTNLEKLPATQQTNSDQAKIFRQLVTEKRVSFPDKPDFNDELFRLNETVSREGLVKVEDKDYHDDQFDAVSRALYLCFNHKDSNFDSFKAKQRLKALQATKGIIERVITGKPRTPLKVNQSNVRKPGQVRRR